jgi:hypothetical protein
MSNTDQVNPSREGWPAAIATVLLAVALWFTAQTIHNRTYHDPTDVLESKPAPAAQVQH